MSVPPSGTDAAMASMMVDVVRAGLTLVGASRAGERIRPPGFPMGRVESYAFPTVIHLPGEAGDRSAADHLVEDDPQRMRAHLRRLA